MYTCLAIAIVLAIIVFGAHNFELRNEVLLYAIGVAVAILPEGLPAVVIVTMAVGVSRMAKQKAIVRKLVALEVFIFSSNSLFLGARTSYKHLLRQDGYSYRGKDGRKVCLDRRKDV
jgi:hypothetical protein